jgi:SecD/SecF fusion protein
MPIIALLIFGGTPGSTELTDFAFALLIGVASGAYSSIFIASPVLTHWKERESQYRHRRQRIESELGYVPAYAGTAGDVEPTPKSRRRAGRLTTPEGETVSAAEFEQMKRDIAEEERETSRTSTLTKRLAHTSETEAQASRTQKPRGKAAAGGAAAAGAASSRPGTGASRPAASPGPAPQPRDGADGAGNGGPRPDGAPGEVERAPDIAENEGVAPAEKRPAKPRSRNRRHGRRR